MVKLKCVKKNNLVKTKNFDNFSRWNIESVKNLHTFKFSYLFNNEKKKEKVMHWGNFKYF
jgi:hypothetical protein